MINKIVYTIILVSLAVLFSNCGDKCRDVYCGLYGSCDEGQCICNEGYEQDSEGSCTITASAKCLGTYRANEQCNITQEEYFVEVTESASSVTQINISNIYGYANNVVTATVQGNDFSIASQTTADGFEIEGNGTLNNTTITMDFTITRVSDGASDVCSLVMVAQ